MNKWSILRALDAGRPQIAAAIACLFVSVLMGTRLWIFLRGKRHLHLGGDESGGLSEELVLGFPFFVLFLAVTIQLVLMVNARIAVNYAAFVTARSASVWVPACYNGEQPNTVRLTSQEPSQNAALTGPNESSSSKLDRIRSAAVLACAPISPSYLSWLSAYGRRARIAGLPLPESLQNLSGPYANSLNRLDSIFTGEGSLGQVKRLLPRWYYSSLFTAVTFTGAGNAAQFSAADNGDIEVTVEHKFYLQVPFVGRILGEKYQYFLEKSTDGFLSSDIYYAPIRESYTIRNEGERLYPGDCQGGGQ